jgi:putative membrane protein
MGHFIAVWIVTTVSLLILTRLPIGLAARDISTTVIAALVLGLLNAFLRPILNFLAFPVTVLTLGLFSLVINALILMLAGALVRGFEVRGCLSAIVGSILLGLLNALMLAIFT